MIDKIGIGFKCIVILTQFCMMFTLSYAQTDQNDRQSYGYINSDFVSIREAPSLESRILIQLKAGAKFRLLELANNDRWRKVDYNGVVGYIRVSLISPIKDETRSSSNKLNRKERSTSQNRSSLNPDSLMDAATKLSLDALSSYSNWAQNGTVIDAIEASNNATEAYALLKILKLYYPKVLPAEKDTLITLKLVMDSMLMIKGCVMQHKFDPCHLILNPDDRMGLITLTQGARVMVAEYFDVPLDPPSSPIIIER
jgi:hypothetical protein